MATIDLSRPSFRPIDLADFCKQEFPAETLSYLHSSTANLKPWSRQRAILSLERHLYDALLAGGWILREVSAKRWKGGWLISVQCNQKGRPVRRWNSFGATPNEALANAVHKLANWGFETKEWQ